MADDPDYAAPRWLNPDFARLTRNRTTAKSRAGAISFSDIERLERASRTVVGGFSQSHWLLSLLLSQLKQDGYKPSEHPFLVRQFHLCPLQWPYRLLWFRG